MKVNLGVELTDEQRVTLACIIKGKPTKKACSRDDVREFLSGVVCGLKWIGPDETVVRALAADDMTPAVNAGVAVAKVTRVNAGAYTTIEQSEVNRLVAEGKTPEYARGWIGAGRVLAKSGRPPAFMRENA